MLQVKYIPASTGVPVWYLYTVILWLLQVHTVRKNGLLWLLERPAFWKFIGVAYRFNIFPLCGGICCSLYNYPIGIILLDFSATFVSIIDLVAENILFPWILIIG